MRIDWRACLEFKLADMWIGCYWRYEEFRPVNSARLDIWVCLLPCVPLHVTLAWPLSEGPHQFV